MVTLAAHGLGWVFEQPPAIGEIVAGIALGPSVLGAVSPDAQAFLLPNEVAPLPGRDRQDRRLALHVPGRPRAGPERPASRAQSSATRGSPCSSCSGTRSRCGSWPRPSSAGSRPGWKKSDGPVSIDVLAIVFAGLLLSAVATEAIGIHALFGAFLFGAMIPHEGKLAAQLEVRIEDVVGVLLLPVFFAFTGMRTEIGRSTRAGTGSSPA